MAKTCLCPGCSRPQFGGGFCSYSAHQAMRTDAAFLRKKAAKEEKVKNKKPAPIAKVSRKKLEDNDGNMWKASKIKALGDNRAADYRIYIPRRDKYLDEHEECEIKLPGCTWKAIEIHHPAGKIGALLYDITNFIAGCRNCHNWCEEHPVQAKELNFSKSRLANYDDDIPNI